MSSGDICTPAEREISANVGQSILHCLTRGQSLGLLVVTESGFASLIAVLVVFLLISRNVIRHVRRATRPWRLVQLPIEVYILSLFAADWIQALGAVMDIKWVHEGKVLQGDFCHAQGTIQTIGETAVALTTVAIAVHTFMAVWWCRSPRTLLIPSLIVAAIWVFVILFATISGAAHNGSTRKLYTPTPYWCWINNNFAAYQIAGEYLWLWVALFASLLLYIPLYYWSQGYITIDPNEPWWRFHIHRRETIADPSGSRRRSLTLIAYPLVYCLLVLPLSIGRFIEFQEERTGAHENRVPSSATFTVASIFSLSGVANVVLFFSTRQGLLLFDSDAIEEGTTPIKEPLKIETTQMEIAGEYMP